MSKESIYGSSHGSEVCKLARSIIGNAGHITNEEVEVLRFLAYKGDFESKRAVIINKDSKINNLLKEQK
jgi:hypothetical protein